MVGGEETDVSLSEDNRRRKRANTASLELCLQLFSRWDYLPEEFGLNV